MRCEWYTQLILSALQCDIKIVRTHYMVFILHKIGDKRSSSLGHYSVSSVIFFFQKSFRNSVPVTSTLERPWRGPTRKIVKSQVWGRFCSTKCLEFAKFRRQIWYYEYSKIENMQRVRWDLFKRLKRSHPKALSLILYCISKK